MEQETDQSQQQHRCSDADAVLLKRKETTSIPPTSIESLLYPELPKDYFRNKGDVFGKKSNLQILAEKHEKAKVKPYFSAIDFNNDEDAPYVNKPKMGYEIGLEFSF